MDVLLCVVMNELELTGVFVAIGAIVLCALLVALVENKRCAMFHTRNGRRLLIRRFSFSFKRSYIMTKIQLCYFCHELPHHLIYSVIELHATNGMAMMGIQRKRN